MSLKYYEKGGFREGSFFIDSTGTKYLLLEVKKKRRCMNPFRWFRPSPAIIVDNRIGRPEKLTLEEVKRVIIDNVVNNNWYKQGDQTERQFREMINNTNNYGELFAVISFYGKWQG